MELEGLPTSRNQVKQLGKRFRNGTDTPADLAALRAYRLFHAQDVRGLFAEIGDLVGTEDVLVTARIKRLDAVVRKLNRESGMDLNRITDILGFRIIVGSVRQYEEVRASLCAIPDVALVKDYVTSPLESGYRAFHIHRKRSIVYDSLEGEFQYEVQLRTFYQHVWASVVESYGERAKEGHGNDDQRRFFSELAERIARWEGENPEAVQSDLTFGKEPVFAVVNVTPPRDPDVMVFGEDLGAAIEHMEYLEGLTKTASERRIVLVAVPNPDRDLITSYSSYYRPPELADLPNGVRDGLDFPS